MRLDSCWHWSEDDYLMLMADDPILFAELACITSLSLGRFVTRVHLVSYWSTCGSSKTNTACVFLKVGSGLVVDKLADE